MIFPRGLKPLMPLLVFLLLAALPLILTSFMGESVRAGVAPEIKGIHEWFNSEPLTMAEMRGKVVLVDFWTYSCINCIRTLPYLRAWDEYYRDQGLVIIGVHTPEFGFEKDRENVSRSIERLGIRYPVAMDNDRKTWNAYANRFWPHKYLIDAQGNIRFEQIGEGGYRETELMIRKLLEEAGQTPREGVTRVAADEVQFREIKTPELYLGIDQGGFLGNPRGFRIGPVEYLEPDRLEENLFYLVGLWSVGMERIEYVGDGPGKILLQYTAKSVNLVAGSPGRTIEVEALLDERPMTRANAGRDIELGRDGSSILRIDGERLYSVVHDGSGYGRHTLTLIVRGKGLQAYTFTFG